MQGFSYKVSLDVMQRLYGLQFDLSELVREVAMSTGTPTCLHIECPYDKKDAEKPSHNNDYAAALRTELELHEDFTLSGERINVIVNNIVERLNA